MTGAPRDHVCPPVGRMDAARSKPAAHPRRNEGPGAGLAAPSPKPRRTERRHDQTRRPAGAEGNLKASAMNAEPCPTCHPDSAEGRALKKHGITRILATAYLIGGYRYTSLADAVAQARRLAYLER